MQIEIFLMAEDDHHRSHHHHHHPPSLSHFTQVRMQSTLLRSYDWLIIRDKREMLGICVVINDLWRQIASGAAFRERLAVTRAGQKAAG